MTDTIRYTGDVGCLIHDRQTVESANIELIQLAQSYGFQFHFPVQDQATIDDVQRGEADPASEAFANACEALYEIANDAEAYLNEHVAQPGYRFGWEDGEFYYQADDEYEPAEPTVADCD